MDFLALLKRQLLPILISCDIVLVLVVIGGITGIIQRNSPSHAANYSPALKQVPEKAVLAKSTIGYPLRLKIPKIGVDAPLDYVRITDKGELAAPKLPANVGWYDIGPRPGEKGSAVIDGHYGWKNNIPAVFDDLSRLGIGDNISTVDDRGKERIFLVTGIRTYSPLDDAAAVFHSADDKAHLNLITCQGTWSQTNKSYSNRLVVFTTAQ
jgi:LPXTG-site transpeptidase (sortase) family protein